MLKVLYTAAAVALLALSMPSFARNSSADWWTALDLSAADVGEAALPWTTHPRLADEEPNVVAQRQKSSPADAK